MAIQETLQVDIAAVEVNDDYRVELTQIRKVVDYSPEQAEALSAELLVAAQAARAALQERMVADATRMHATRPVAVDGSVVF